MSEYTPHGITQNTPKRVLLGAGTIHKGLQYDSGQKTWNYKESLVGATSGGNTLTITPEFYTVEVDGALVKVKGLDVKQGETASLEINLIELTADILKSAVVGKENTSDAPEDYTLIESKPDIEEGDYWENIAFVGKKLDGKNIIVILDNALCTSGLSLEGQNKESAVPKYTFECYQELTGDVTVLPYHIYYPTEAQAKTQSQTQTQPET